jgi:hypothetical protein
MEGKDSAMFRKSIVTLAALATLGVAALTPGPASAHWRGGHHMWAFHHMRAYPHMAYRTHFFVRHRFAVRHPIFLRHRFALIGAPILLDDGCVRVHKVWTPRGPRWRHVWVCG